MYAARFVVHTEHKRRRSWLRSLAVGLALVWAVDATKTDMFRVLLVQDFDRLAVEDGDCFAEKVNGKHRFDGEEQRQQKEEETP